MYPVKQSTALTVPFFVHDASGNAVTGLTSASFTKRISKGSGTFAALSVTITEMENGWYSFPLTTTHTNTLGILSITFTNAGAKQVNLQFRVTAKLLDDMNDVAATDIVSAGAITTSSGAVSTVTDVTTKTGYSLAATGLDAIVSTATGMVEIAKAVWDRVLSGATHAIADSAGRRLRDLQEFGVYEDGAIWIDTVNGTAGTTVYESGTAFNPVNTLADAVTLNSTLGLNRFKLAPGSSITLASTFNNYLFEGNDGWTLILDGQNIANSTFVGASVSGAGTGTGTQKFKCCDMGAVTLPANTHVVEGSSITGTQTLPAGDVFYDDCHSGVAGTTAPQFDFGAAVGSTNFNMRHYSGGLDIRNMGATGTDTASVEGNGAITINVNSTGGTMSIRGNFELTNNGSTTITDGARWNESQILSDATPFQGADIAATLADTADMQPKLGTPAADISADIAALNDLSAAEVNAEADTALSDFFTSSAQLVDDVWDEPLSGHTTNGTPGKVLKGINEGWVSAEGTVNDASASTTEFITDLTEATTSFYKDAIVVFTTGTLKGQSRVILAYNGTTKTITLDEAFTSAPGDTESFIILAGHVHSITDIVNSMLDELLSGHTDAGSVGKALADIEVDTADIQTRLPAALVSGKIDANTSAIAGVAASATNLEASTDTILPGTASGAPTTTTMISDISVTVDDQFNGRTIIFASDTSTAALQGQATDITGCTAATNTLTFTALTTAPASGETFIVV